MTPPSKSDSPAWKPLIYFWDGGWIGVGVARGVVPPHSHHAVQITLGLEREVAFREPDGEWIAGAAVVIPPNVMHSFDGRDALVSLLFVDPESREGRWLRNSVRGPIHAVGAERVAEFPPRLLGFMERRPSAEEAARVVGGLARSLCDGPPPLKRMDERIGRALAWVRDQESYAISLEQAAREVFLSPSRFAHLFTDEVGLPFRRYLLWRKLNRAMQAFGRGVTLTEAAQEGGFSDSAHLTRTFYQMFGIPPTVMLVGGEFYEIPAPFELALPDSV